MLRPDRARPGSTTSQHRTSQQIGGREGNGEREAQPMLTRAGLCLATRSIPRAMAEEDYSQRNIFLDSDQYFRRPGPRCSLLDQGKYPEGCRCRCRRFANTGVPDDSEVEFIHLLDATGGVRVLGDLYSIRPFPVSLSTCILNPILPSLLAPPCFRRSDMGRLHRREPRKPPSRRKMDS